MTFLNVIEIESALTALASTYPTVTTLITLPFMTAEGRQSHAIRIGSGTCPTTKIGIDVNRNYDFLWDFPVTFANAAVGAGTLASNDPASDLFHGTAPFSEAESKNVRWLFEQYPPIGWFIDIHSYGGDILHAWGDDENQSSNTGMNFTNAAWNGQRGVKNDTYGEYISTFELSHVQATANHMSAAIGAVHGQPYAV